VRYGKFKHDIVIPLFKGDEGFYCKMFSKSFNTWTEGSISYRYFNAKIIKEL
jgi:hypothetical protein